VNNPLPAALASIKRYDIDVYGNAHERKGGAWMAAVDVLATLPPPADGAVAWQWRTHEQKLKWKPEVPEGYWSSWTEITKEDYAAHCAGSKLAELRYEVRELFAAPPADSAMERIKELEQALEPFAKFCSSEEKIALVVNTAYVRAARKALAWDARTLLAGRK
jgi:hypothetical protein